MKTYNKENIFYVYAYLDPRKRGDYKFGEYVFNYEPFYIGKGQGDRASSHLKKFSDYNNHKNNLIKKIIREDKQPIIVFIKQNLLEEDSLKLEMELIKLIGRKDTKKGNLTNLTDGGEGASGLKWTEDSKEKMRGENNPFYNGIHSHKTIEIVKNNNKKRAGKTWEEIMGDEKAKKLRARWREERKGENNPSCINKGKSLEEICGEEKAKELKKRWSKSHTGMKYSEETNKKKGKKGEDNYFSKNPMKGSKNGRALKFIITDPTGTAHIVHGEIFKFCKENNLSYSIIQKLRKKEIPDYNGWTLVELSKGNDLAQFDEV